METILESYRLIKDREDAMGHFDLSLSLYFSFPFNRALFPFPTIQKSRFDFNQRLKKNVINRNSR